VRKMVTVLAMTLAGLGFGGARARAEMDPLVWQVCPFLLEVGTEAIKARLRLKLNSEDLGPAFAILCRAGQYYDQKPGAEKEFDPAQSERLREFLCKTQDIKYCTQPAKPFAPTPSPETVLADSEADRRAQQLVELCHQLKLTKTQCLIKFSDSPDMAKQ
jgi:hypothetical protein